MGNISSANFKKSKDFQVYHNADIRPSYAIGGGLEVNRNGAEALALKKQIIEQAIDTYNRTKKPKAPPFKAKSYEWSLVVNLKESSTMQDLETLSAHFKNKYGFQCYQIAIHRDEGHIDENGKECINHHAHLEFITLDKETGKNRFRGGFATAKCLRAVQDEVAEILQMERGVDKRLSGAKRVEPRKYAIMKEREKAERKADLEKVKREKNIPLEIRAEFAETKLNELKAKNATLKEENEKLQVENQFLNREKEELLNPKEVKETLESFRKQCIGKGLPKEFFRALSAEKQSPKQSTKQDLELFCADLLRAYEKEREAREKAENDRARLATELESKNAQNRDFVPTNSATLDTPKSAETTQSVETTQKTEPKIDAPVKVQQKAEVTPSVEKEQNILDKLNNDELKDLENIAQKSKICGWGVEKIENEMQKIHAWQVKNDYKAQSDYPQWGKIDTNESQLRDSLKKFTFWFAKKFKISEIRNFLGAVFEKFKKKRIEDEKYEQRMADIDAKIRMIEQETKETNATSPAELRKTLETQNKVEQMKEQVKKAVYNQRETPKKDLGMSR